MLTFSSSVSRAGLRKARKILFPLLLLLTLTITVSATFAMKYQVFGGKYVDFLQL